MTSPKRQTLSNFERRSALPGCSTFALPGRRRKRSKFTAERKKEVKKVRDVGACLRCRLLKHTCSGGTPCDCCRAIDGGERVPRKNRWMECIRPPVSKYNVFGHYADARSGVFDSDALCDSISGVPVDLDFEVPFEWNLNEVAQHFADWVAEDEANSTFSKVGVWSSTKFIEILSQALGKEISDMFRALMIATSLLYNWTYPHKCYRDQWMDDMLTKVAAHSGTTVLRRLDDSVKVERLKTLSSAKLKGLFLLTLGSVVSAFYFCAATQSLRKSQARNESSVLNHSTTTTCAEDCAGCLESSDGDQRLEKLVTSLCHYAVFFGTQAKLFDPTTSNKFLVERTKLIWGRKACFSWNISGLKPSDSVCKDPMDGNPGLSGGITTTDVNASASIQQLDNKQQLTNILCFSSWRERNIRLQCPDTRISKTNNRLDCLRSCISKVQNHLEDNLEMPWCFICGAPTPVQAISSRGCCLACEGICIPQENLPHTGLDNYSLDTMIRSSCHSEAIGAASTDVQFAWPTELEFRIEEFSELSGSPNLSTPNSSSLRIDTSTPSDDAGGHDSVRLPCYVAGGRQANTSLGDDLFCLTNNLERLVL